jgi:hypothetical protein
MEQQKRIEIESVQEGSRWLHAPPSSEDVRLWFSGQRIHTGMEHDRYVGGVVLINDSEKISVTVEADNGRRYVDESQRATFTPYVRVDTRVSYFWDLVDALNEDRPDGTEYFGYIRPSADVPIIDDTNSPWYNAYLPRGYHFSAVRLGDDKGGGVVRYIGFTSDVQIVRYKDGDDSGRTVLRGIDTKMVPLVNSNGFADDHALTRARTGANGRALGVAGILVIGTGVATAEDVQEAQTMQGGATMNSGPSLPAVATPQGAEERPVSAPVIAAPDINPEIEQTQVMDAVKSWDNMSTDERREYVTSLARAYKQEFEIEYNAVLMPWWRDREFGGVETLSEDELQAVVIKLERDLDMYRNQ